MPSRTGNSTNNVLDIILYLEKKRYAITVAQQLRCLLRPVFNFVYDFDIVYNILILSIKRNMSQA